MFDARAARGLAAGEHIVIEGAPGLRLEATATARTWTYRYRSPIDGRMRQIKLGRWPAMGLPAALAAWQAAKDARDAGADLSLDRRRTRAAQAAQAAAARYTVRRACDDFLRAYAGTVAPKTHREAAKLLALIPEALAGREAASITRADAFDLLDGMRETPVQAANLRRLLGAVWDRSLDAGRLPATAPNWWRLVLRGQLRSRGKAVGGERRGPVKRVLSEAELRLLLPWLPNFSRDVSDALALMLWTCCRGSEVVAMRADELEEGGGVLWWTIPRARLKMRRVATTVDLRVPLVGRAEQIVRRRLLAASGPWIFPSRAASGHIEQKALGVAVWTHHARCELRKEWVRPRLPVPDWASHDLRRTGRTLLAAMGCPADVAEAILGHAQPGIQGTYNRHGYDSERLRWLTSLADRLEALAGPA